MTTCLRCGAKWRARSERPTCCRFCGAKKWDEPYDYATRKKHEKHGLTGHPLYHVWNSLIRRCTIQHHHAYKYYGGRGITVCDKWMSFPGFLDDMEKSYAPGLTVDRIRNNEGYSKENCRWATAKQQTRNTNRNRYVTINGETKTRIEWMEFFGVKKPTLQKRLRRMSIEEALTTPIYKPKRRED